MGNDCSVSNSADELGGKRNQSTTKNDNSNDVLNKQKSLNRYANSSIDISYQKDLGMKDLGLKDNQPQVPELADPADDFTGTKLYSNITPAQEVFQQDKIPVVNQDPLKFNDDDSIVCSLYNLTEVIKLKNFQQLLKEWGDIDIIKKGIQFERKLLDKTLVKSNYSLLQFLQGLRQTQNEVQVALLVSLITNEIKLENQMGRIPQRPGIDLICVIDHSGSMSGEKMKLVKRTLKHMLEFLNDKDRLCLIQFDCECYRLTRLMRVTEENIPKFRIAIHSLQARGGTNIENGMHMAFSILRHRQFQNPVTTIFLLSDGVDVKAEERVATSMARCNLKDTFTIKTFGFGRDVCPKTMSEIAHMKEGQFYFVPDLDKIDECFVEALGGLVSVIANNVQVFVKSQDQSKITKAYGDKWQYDIQSSMYKLYQPHLLSGIHKDFIFEVTIPSEKQSQPSVVSVRVEVEPIDSKEKLVFEEMVKINQIDEGDVQNQEVMAQYMRVRGAECFNFALQHAENGKHDEGQKLISEAILQMNTQDQNNYDPQMQMVKNDLLLAQRYCYPGLYEKEGRHHMMQLHIVHMYQKSRGVQIQVQEDSNTNRDGSKNGDQQQNVNQQLIVVQHIQKSAQNQKQIDCVYQNNVQKAFKDYTRQLKQTTSYGQE